MSDNPFILGAAIIAGFLTLGAGVGFSTWVAGMGLRLSDRFGGYVFWMAWAFAIVVPLYLGSFAAAAGVAYLIAKATGA